MQFFLQLIILLSESGQPLSKLLKYKDSSTLTKSDNSLFITFRDLVRNLGRHHFKTAIESDNSQMTVAKLIYHFFRGEYSMYFILDSKMVGLAVLIPLQPIFFNKLFYLSPLFMPLFFLRPFFVDFSVTSRLNSPCIIGVADSLRLGRSLLFPVEVLLVLRLSSLFLIDQSRLDKLIL
jgi:hypothetical protein